MRIIFIFLLSILPFISWAGLELDGVDDFCDTTASLATGSAARTYSCWFRTSSSAAVAMLSNGNNTGTAIAIGFVCENGTLAGRFFGGYFFTKAVTCNDGNWHHFAYAYNGGAHQNALIMYDGVALTGLSFGNGANPLNTGSDFDMVIGKQLGFGGDTSYFDGEITDISYWDAALVAAQLEIISISQGKRMPLQIAPSNLQHYWVMDDIAEGVSVDGQTLRDIVGGDDATGDDGGNNTGLTGAAEKVLSYP